MLTCHFFNLPSPFVNLMMANEMAGLGGQALSVGLGSLTSLESLNLSRINFGGSLPTNWDFPAMVTLNLTSCWLGGTIPAGKFQACRFIT